MATPKQEKLIKLISKQKKEIGEKFVYVAQCDCYYKIGIAYNLESRINTLQVGNPYKIDFYTCLKTKKAKEIEKKLHKLFEKKRLRGEWYELSEEDLNTILSTFEYEQSSRKTA